MREASVEAHLRRRVKAKGGRCLKFVSPGNRHVPDRLVLWPIDYERRFVGSVHFVELKAPGKKLRAGQARERQRLERAGFRTFVLDTKAKVDDYIRVWS